MKHVTQVESARRGSNQQPHRPYVRTDPRFPKGEEREFVSLRGPSQHDHRQMTASRQVAHVQFDALAGSPAHLGLRSGTRRSSWPISSRLESPRPTGRSAVEVDLVGRPGLERVVRSISVVQAHDETPMVPRLLFRTGGTPGTEGQPRCCARWRRGLEPFSM